MYLRWNLRPVSRAAGLASEELSGGPGLLAHGATGPPDGDDEAVPWGRGRGRHVRARCRGAVSVWSVVPARVLLRVRMEGRGSGDAGAGHLTGSTVGCHVLAARLRFFRAVARRRGGPSGSAVRPLCTLRIVRR